MFEPKTAYLLGNKQDERNQKIVPCVLLHLWAELRLLGNKQDGRNQKIIPCVLCITPVGGVGAPE